MAIRPLINFRATCPRGSFHGTGLSVLYVLRRIVRGMVRRDAPFSRELIAVPVDLKRRSISWRDGGD